MFKNLIAFLIFIFVGFVHAESISSVSPDTFPTKLDRKLSQISETVEWAIKEGSIPGAVVVIGKEGRIIYKRAFGLRSVKPESRPMTEDTIFDVASLTKVVATSTAVMQLAEKGKLDVDAPVYKYWPEFKSKGKKNITIRHLLTHYSGLRPSLKLNQGVNGYDKVMQKIISEKPLYSPGKCFVYSDINFEILGEIVRRVSGKTLDTYCYENIFRPLGMDNTFFNPSAELYDRIAPTEFINGTQKILCGQPHDPTARKMGGVSGHAGLFSTADDLSIFVRMLLNGGSYNGVRIMNPTTVEMMISAQSPDNKKELRGFGWDIDSQYSVNRGEVFPVGSYGHTGYTGTSIWIDPYSKTFVIVLTNRVHPNGKGDARKLYKDIATFAAEALANNSSHASNNNNKVLTGIDVLKQDKFAQLSGLSIGLITNQSAVDSDGMLTLDLFFKASNVKISAVFSPEHGLSGRLDGEVRSAVEPLTKLPVYSLYGETKRPTAGMLNGIDALVFDVQDVGVRFYTYITTMAYAMEAAAEKGIPFFVLDRANPITASVVQGPVMDKDLQSFTGYFPLPLRHGMTVGELAVLFNEENRIGAKLHVIKMQGYNRDMWFDDTGYRWISPSPNLRSFNGTVLYPGVALVEGANVSVGRGTDTPFEVLGAPWISPKRLSLYLNKRNIPGVRFEPAKFRPRNNRFKDELCRGIKIILLDRNSLDVVRLGIEITSALYRLYPKEFKIDKTLPLIGSIKVLQSIKQGKNPKLIVQSWQEELEEFKKLRAKYLLY